MFLPRCLIVSVLDHCLSFTLKRSVLAKRDSRLLKYFVAKNIELTKIFTHFPGDIGGSMGLFIGASMLTIVEVIDLVLSQTPVFASQREKKSTRVEF